MALTSKSRLFALNAVVNVSKFEVVGIHKKVLRALDTVEDLWERGYSKHYIAKKTDLSTKTIRKIIHDNEWDDED